MGLLSKYYPGSNFEAQVEIEKRVGRHSLFIAVFLVVVLWLIKLAEVVYGSDFSGWGNVPRSQAGLLGILLSPLVHGSFNHLAANTIPLFVLTFSLFFFYRKYPYAIFVLIYLFSGIFVWLTGRGTSHIGASGLIYGLAAYLFLSGILSKNIGLLTISLIVALLYGGLIWGIFPVDPQISWESHLWGAITGFGLAYLFRTPLQPEPFEDKEEDELFDGEWDRGEEETGEEENSVFR